MLPPIPSTRRRLLALPRLLVAEARFAADLRLRRWRRRCRHPRLSARWAWLVRAWARTDPHNLERLLERIRAAGPPPPLQPPPAGTEARYTGPLTARAAWGELRLGDRDVCDWLVDALGDPGDHSVPVELVVRVLDRPDAPTAAESA